MSVSAQVVMVLLRIDALMVLARLLLQEDFGLVNMVSAFIGLRALLRDAGLSMATVQSFSLTSAQASTLFWIDLAVGGVLGLVTIVTAPIMVAFYNEPRLFWVTIASATIIVCNGAAAQHRAML